jgi:hypothetical protein
MFPAGAAGGALVILRLTAAASLLAQGTEHPFPPTWFTLLALGLPAAALCLGFLTPYTSGIGCLIEFSVIIRSGSHAAFPILISTANTAALGILGPGAYSLDASIFGRRVVRFSTTDQSGP